MSEAKRHEVCGYWALFRREVERFFFFFFFEKAGIFFFYFFFYRFVGIGFTCFSHINIGLIYVQESHM